MWSTSKCVDPCIPWLIIIFPSWIHEYISVLSLHKQQVWNSFPFQGKMSTSQRCKSEGLKNRKMDSSCLISPTSQTGGPSIRSFFLALSHSGWTAVQYISYPRFIRCWLTAWNICVAWEKTHQFGSISRDRVCGIVYRNETLQAGKGIKKMI